MSYWATTALCTGYICGHMSKNSTQTRMDGAHVVDCAIKVTQLMTTVGCKHDYTALVSSSKQELFRLLQLILLFEFEATNHLLIVGEGEIHAREADVCISHGIHVHFLCLQGMHIDVVQVTVTTNSNDKGYTISGKYATLQNA
jgi:hypothetical protein